LKQANVTELKQTFRSKLGSHLPSLPGHFVKHGKSRSSTDDTVSPKWNRRSPTPLSPLSPTDRKLKIDPEATMSEPLLSPSRRIPVSSSNDDLVTDSPTSIGRGSLDLSVASELDSLEKKSSTSSLSLVQGKEPLVLKSSSTLSLEENGK
jgi:hypothetical protein